MESINVEYLIGIRDSLLSIAEEIKQNDNGVRQKLLEICEGIDGPISDKDEFQWPMSIKDLCRNFDLHRDTVHSHKRNYLIEGKDYFIQDSGRPDKAICFERSGALKIFEHCRSEKAVRYRNKCGSSFSPKEEHLYINTIRHAVNGFDITKKGFKVETSKKDYYIDLYLQNVNLAIECDERGHYHEYSDELRKREEDIFKKLGCKFLRFNPHEIDFNVGEVINVIFHYIFNKLISGENPIDYYMKKRKRKLRERQILTDVDLADYD